MELYKEVRKSIVKKLFKKGCFGKGHMLAIRLHKSLPKQFIPYSKKAIKELTRREIILIKKTKHGMAAYLNMKQLHEIEKIIYEEH